VTSILIILTRIYNHYSLYILINYSEFNVLLSCIMYDFNMSIKYQKYYHNLLYLIIIKWYWMCNKTKLNLKIIYHAILFQ